MRLTLTKNIKRPGHAAVSISIDDYTKMGSPKSLVYEQEMSKALLRFPLLDDLNELKVHKEKTRLKFYINNLTYGIDTGKYKLDNSIDPEIFNLKKI